MTSPACPPAPELGDAGGVEPFKMLTSYAYFRSRDMDAFTGKMAGPAPLVFGDSGAHSARTLGIHLTLEDYAAWCRQWDQVLTVYSNLDVIRAPRATWGNQKALEARGLCPIPVFHTGTPWSWLEHYLDEGYTYIALGKLLGHPPKHVLPWLAKAFRIADGRAVFHGFGMTVWAALKEFPFYSVDSSTWGSGFRYGNVRLFDDRRGRWVNIPLRDREAVRRHRELIRTHGGRPSALASRATYDRKAVAGMAAVAYRRAETWLRRRHGAVTVPPGPHNPLARRDVGHGLHIHLAEGTVDKLEAAAAGVHMYLAETEMHNFRPAAQGVADYQAPHEATA